MIYLNLRRAKPNESDVLNFIAFESESIWGEDESYMDLFSQEYKVTKNMIENDYVYVMEDDKGIIGFFAILKKDNETSELELFYIKKSFIGKGYGTLLWTNMISICKEKGIRKIGLVGSSDVANFYKKLGAKEIGEMKSLLKVGRIVSKFEYKIV
ncbi:Acetyltransferase (GNAT) domain-containing protein [Alkaliphilus peptidifermentans DSM 18978]|uniref:Acetyltransferase (GNAT) domain-containing protein n=1 Tax=Alkaliphilus peptidifermentans DSM 18978 TaxID=1120976 RepID=A0A1G5KP06_9FIRM|nr:Acetyltransferase (GNAT) domain-containing protein [Alkaliphilus peptidifermentans DSM 18978]